MGGSGGLEEKLSALLEFIDSAPLTTTIAELEHALDGRMRGDVEELLCARGVSSEVLQRLVVDVEVDETI